jgi:hypothetical protein
LGDVKLDDEQFDRLLRAVTKISHGDLEPHGFESLVMALSGDSISGRASLGRQTYDGLYAVACAVDNLADAYRERTRDLGRGLG